MIFMECAQEVEMQQPHSSQEINSLNALPKTLFIASFGLTLILILSSLLFRYTRKRNLHHDYSAVSSFFLPNAKCAVP